jgi:hypothetical protein
VHGQRYLEFLAEAHRCWTEVGEDWGRRGDVKHVRSRSRFYPARQSAMGSAIALPTSGRAGLVPVLLWARRASQSSSEAWSRNVTGPNCRERRSVRRPPAFNVLRGARHLLNPWTIQTRYGGSNDRVASINRPSSRAFSRRG